MIINRYIMIHILKGALVTLLALVCFNLLIIFIDELGDLGKGGYDLSAVTQYTVMRIPALLVEFMPLAALLGSMPAWVRWLLTVKSLPLSLRAHRMCDYCLR